MITAAELISVCRAALLRRTPEGLSWPLSLTFNDASYVHAVRFLQMWGTAMADEQSVRYFIGHDLGRNERIKVAMDDLGDAYLTEGTWKEAVLPPLPPHNAALEALWEAFSKRKQAVAVLVSQQRIPPRDDPAPCCAVTLNFDLASGGPLGEWECIVAASLIDPDVAVNSKVQVEYTEKAPGVLDKVVRIDPLPPDLHEEV